MPSAVFFQVATRKVFVVRELPEKSVQKITALGMTEGGKFLVFKAFQEFSKQYQKMQLHRKQQNLYIR